MYDPLYDRPSFVRRTFAVLGAGLLGGAVVTALGLGVHHVKEDPSFRVQQVEILGQNRATTAQLRHLANVPRDAHLAQVDLGAVRRGVERHPWVETATVRRRFPSTIEIEVVEHEPRLLLALDELWYVDGKGLPIKRAEGDDLDYPVLTGVDPQLVDSRPELGWAVVRGALRVLDATPGSVVDPLTISEVHHDHLQGYSLVLRSGTRLVLGDGPPQPGLGRLARMVDAGLDLDRPQRIDLAVETVAIATPLPAIRP